MSGASSKYALIFFVFIYLLSERYNVCAIYSNSTYHCCKNREKYQSSEHYLQCQSTLLLPILWSYKSPFDVSR